VQFLSDAGSAWTTFADGTSTSVDAVVTGLTNGVSHRFRVAAVNAIGTGEYTQPSAAVTPIAEFLAPVLTRVSCNGDGLVAFSWSSVAGATNYRLQTNANRNSAAGTYTDVQLGVSRSWSGDVAGQDFGQGWFRVRAEDGAQVTPYSNLVQADCAGGG
jgi:hypothetical protein